MFRLFEPSDAVVAAFVEKQRGKPFTYEAIGGTRGPPPHRWHHEEARVHLGDGAVFDRARAAIQAWTPLDLGWVKVRSAPPIAVDGIVAFTARRLGVVALSACRIVYVVDEPDAYGFAYGTLMDHPVAGEERFLVTREADGTWYGIKKFFLPNHRLARLAGPFGRAVQARFTQDSLEAMRRTTTR